MDTLGIGVPIVTSHHVHSRRRKVAEDCQVPRLKQNDTKEALHEQVAKVLQGFKGEIDIQEFMVMARRGALFVLLLGTMPAPAAGYDLTGRWQLFVDDEGVANRSSSVTRRYHQFVKHPGASVRSPNRRGRVCH